MTSFHVNYSFFFLCFRRNPHEVGYFHPITTIFYSICLSISQLSSPFFTTLISPVIFSFFSYHNHLFSFYWYELSYILMRYRSPFSSAQTSPRSNRILLEKYCQICRQLWFISSSWSSKLFQHHHHHICVRRSCVPNAIIIIRLVLTLFFQVANVMPDQTRATTKMSANRVINAIHNKAWYPWLSHSFYHHRHHPHHHHHHSSFIIHYHSLFIARISSSFRSASTVTLRKNGHRLELRPLLLKAQGWLLSSSPSSSPVSFSSSILLLMIHAVCRWTSSLSFISSNSTPMPNNRHPNL